MFASTPRDSLGVELSVLQRLVWPAPTGQNGSWSTIRSFSKAVCHCFECAFRIATWSVPLSNPHRNRLQLTCGAKDELVQEISQLTNYLVNPAAGGFSPVQAELIIHLDVFGYLVRLQICNSLISKRTVDSGAYLCIAVRYKS